MDREVCSRCGRQTDGEEPRGLCPSCLLQSAGFDEATDARECRCTSCDSMLPDDARFCASCGSAVPVSPQVPDDLLRHAIEAKLGAQYRVLRLLGRGGMGAVYLARDLTLEREVAIKVVKPASDARGMYDRFRLEARTAAKLSHPNIVPLHAFGEVDGMPYFVMGYVRGESLADRMRRDGKLPEDEVRRILAEIADALDHAHRLGIVHRDVKPDNVLLEDASGRALLTDFGIAKLMRHAESLTQHGSVVGTPQYMSPEQASGRGSIDGRSDIYSLGIMGFAMLAGRLPFEGNSSADILARHLTQEPPPLRSLVPGISDSTLQAVERCMAKDPAKRWQDARALRTRFGVTEEGGLPDALESTRGHGLSFVMIAAVLLGLGYMVVYRLQNAPIGVLGIIAGGLLSCYVAIVAHLRMEGFPLSLIQRVIWTEPPWWPFWYPRAGRRRNNVWDRVPKSVRRHRSYFPLIFISLAIAAINPGERFREKVIVFSFVFIIGVVLELRAKGELKRMGVASSNDRDRIASLTPLSRSRFWSQPHIAMILAPAAEGKVLRRAESPHDQLRSILRVADELSGPLRPLGAEAADAARRLIVSIDESDRQIAELARNVEPGEEQRLVEKVEALADLSESAPMRQLIEKQLELIRGLGARIEEANGRRNRHMEILKTLALHLSTLQARLTETPSEVRSLSDNVRALCDRISQPEMQAGTGDLPTSKL